MSDHALADQYGMAMAILEKYIHQERDGTFTLTIHDGREAGIEDPVIFADLRRSLDETNRKIREKMISPEEIDT